MAFKLITERSITDVIFIAKQLQGHYRAITSILKIFILHINNTKISYLCNEICLNLTHFKNNFILYRTKNLFNFENLNHLTSSTFEPIYNQKHASIRKKMK